MAKRVLIVDDHEPFARSAWVLLERQGLRVAGIASTIAEARAQVNALRPDIVLVDVMLGEESGFDLADDIERDGHGLAPVVVLISTLSPEELADLIAASPAAGFLRKQELSATRILQIVDRRQADADRAT